MKTQLILLALLVFISSIPAYSEVPSTSSNPFAALAVPSDAERADMKKMSPDEIKAFGELMQRSCDLYDAGDYARADSGFAEMINRAPNSRIARIFHALCLQQQGEIEQARQTAAIAYGFDPTIPSVVVIFADLTSATSDYSKAMSLYNEALKLSLTELQAAIIRRRISILKAELDKRTKVNDAENSHDYFALATFYRITKWHEHSFPLKVFIPKSDTINLKYFNPAFTGAVRQAFDDWREASKGLVSFTFVEDPTQANIDCAWKERPAGHVAMEGGLCEMFMDLKDHYLIKASITLFLEREKSAQEMTTVALHEIGHSLGIDGHSSRPTDVMFEELVTRTADKNAMKISGRDANTLAKLYSPEVKVTQQVNAPSPNMRPGPNTDPSTLNEQGLALVHANRNTEALPFFEQAYKLEPSSAYKMNLAECMNSIAIEHAQAGRRDQAMECFTRAISLADNPHSRANYMRNVGRVYVEQHKPSEARSEFVEADKLDGGSSTATYDSAVAAVEAKRTRAQNVKPH
jgi:tetratricopeptide (TPR) repeat protein